MTVLAHSKIQNLDVLVVCPEPGTENVLRKIRQWNTEEGPLLNKWQINSCVKKIFDLPSALNTANKNMTQSILVPIGFTEQEVRDSLARQTQNNLEVIIRPPRWGQNNEQNEFPSSSLLTDKQLIIVQNTLPALHKSCLKRYFKDKVKIRSLKTQADFAQYFHLRYEVWKEVGYLRPERNSKKTQWEVDYTDRTALPIGAFDHNGKLIACARLVFPSGRENYHFSLIKQMITQTQDEILCKNFDYPKVLTHPFDVLESFKGFNNFYAGMIRQRIRMAEVSRVIVTPDYRSFGLGEVIVDSIISLAQEQEKLDLVFLACKQGHKDFYQRCGFAALNGVKSDHFVNMKVQSIAMVRNLKQKKIHINSHIH